MQGAEIIDMLDFGLPVEEVVRTGLEVWARVGREFYIEGARRKLRYSSHHKLHANVTKEQQHRWGGKREKERKP
jgi:hypothetical protein